MGKHRSTGGGSGGDLLITVTVVVFVVGACVWVLSVLGS